ncbi:ABC transporter ATP-binding protein [Paraburkholderia rhynchosiae]|uniref:ABC transporter ATP-binding protein n=1 Tax=Paraburkholderia rhynchosiae TaxID=487049 RepID=A0A2N7VUU1_9BURK|nr:ABC transporter ATP-binding protein [Paraburkholderia rhynchosiae]PMS20935.1 ABC transporter ATP-binding protein [Paraburkholderia rhynchosiae]CAB3741542.1 Lipoprotein-releasing system ATP-binding protein LolD [Paraburkholderia rhynchosiae]
MVLRDEDVVPALECRGLNKKYGAGRIVLASLDFTLAPGEFVAIMGDSGVGKSTLLNLIAGLDRADSGEVMIDGSAVSSLDDNAATRLRRQKLGFVFQAFHVLPHLTLAQNVALPLLLNELPTSAALDMLAAVGLAGRGDDFPRQLSGGELQRVAIARALVHRPTLILADEPTGNLDPDTAHDVLALFRGQSKATGAATMMVTHSQAAAAVADRIMILSDGGLHAASGAPALSRTQYGSRTASRSADDAR